jgi:hypothetical protein
VQTSAIGDLFVSSILLEVDVEASFFWYVDGKFWMCDLNALYYFIENVRSVAFQRGQWIVMSPEYNLYTENMLFVVGFVRIGSALLRIW